MERHGGLTHWNDDLDICVLDKDEDKRDLLEENLEHVGYKLVVKSQSCSWRIVHMTDFDEVQNSHCSHSYPL